MAPQTPSPPLANKILPLPPSHAPPQKPYPQPPPKIILEAISRLTLYRMQEQARKEFDAGEYEEASTRLQNMATHLFSTGEVELAKTVLKEAQNIQNRKKYSKEGQKRIKYGTRALISPTVNRKPQHHDFLSNLSS